MVYNKGIRKIEEEKMTNQQIEQLIQEKKKQINKLEREIKELQEEHTLLKERYEIDIVVKRKCKKNTKGSFEDIMEGCSIKVDLIPQQSFSQREKAKNYALKLRRKIQKGEIKIIGKKYSHIAMLDKTKKDYQIIWTC